MAARACRCPAAAAILEEIQRAGCNGAACHAQMYIMGSAAAARQRGAEAALPAEDRDRRIAPAGLRRHRADQRHRHHLDQDHCACVDGDRYVVNGQKIWTSRAEHSDLMLLLARTTPQGAGRRSAPTACRSSSSTCGRRKSAGLSIRPIRTMMNHATTEVFFDNVESRPRTSIGEEGKGFRYISRA